MACWTYEGLLLFSVAFFSTLLFSAAGQMRNAMDPRRPLLIGFLLIVFGIYFTWFWARGQTLAMQTWRITLVDAQGNAVSQPRALLRFLLSWLWFLPPLITAALFHPSIGVTALLFGGWLVGWALSSRVHPQRQFWHDALAGTRLIDTNSQGIKPSNN